MRIKNRIQAGVLCLLTTLPMAVLAGTKVYIPLGSANAIAVVDADSDRVVAEIPDINASHGLAVSWDGEWLVAGSLLERPIGTAPPKPQEMSEEEHAAHHSKDNPTGQEKTVKGQTVGVAYLIDAKTHRLIRQLDVPGAVHHALLTPNGRFAVFTHPGRRGISVVDVFGHQEHKEIKTGHAPNYAVSKRDGSRIYVSNAGEEFVSEIDTATWTVLRNLPAGKTPEHIVLSPDEQYLYAVNYASGTVSRVDLQRAEVTATYTVGEEPHGIDLSDDARFLYTTSKRENKLVAFNLASGEERSVPLAPAPYHITTIRGTGKFYVSSRKSPKIWVIDQQTLAVRGEIPIRGEGHEMGVVNR